MVCEHGGRDASPNEHLTIPGAHSRTDGEKDTDTHRERVPGFPNVVVYLLYPFFLLSLRTIE